MFLVFIFVFSVYKSVNDWVSFPWIRFLCAYMWGPIRPSPLRAGLSRFIFVCLLLFRLRLHGILMCVWNWCIYAWNGFELPMKYLWNSCALWKYQVSYWNICELYSFFCLEFMIGTRFPVEIFVILIWNICQGAPTSTRVDHCQRVLGCPGFGHRSLFRARAAAPICGFFSFVYFLFF